jgi:hypothetical protein
MDRVGCQGPASFWPRRHGEKRRRRNDKHTMPANAHAITDPKTWISILHFEGHNPALDQTGK